MSDAATTGGAGGSDDRDHRTTSPARIRAIYASQADWADRFDVCNRLLTGRARRRLYSTAEGRVLDVACGNGVNARYLPDGVEYVGVDLSPDMLSKAATRYDEAGRDRTFVEMDAQHLAFADDSFDTVVSALSTCTFPDPTAALDEMARVVRPDGRVLLFEHGRSTVGPIARFQEWRADAHFEKHGCRWTQEPLDVVGRSALRVIDSRTGGLGMLTAIEAVPA